MPGFNGVLRVFTTFNTFRNRLKPPKTLLLAVLAVKRRGIIWEAVLAGFSCFLLKRVKPLFKPPLGVPPGLPWVSLLVLPDRNKDPRLTQEEV